ncbi:hypothetical protein BJV74DRAFT_459817 [Russula compacta]|nr:hypothetical protein BJV74DRAFT_459817 [Russula compacta]
MVISRHRYNATTYLPRQWRGFQNMKRTQDTVAESRALPNSSLPFNCVIYALICASQAQTKISPASCPPAIPSNGERVSESVRGVICTAFPCPRALVATHTGCVGTVLAPRSACEQYRPSRKATAEGTSARLTSRKERDYLQYPYLRTAPCVQFH